MGPVTGKGFLVCKHSDDFSVQIDTFLGEPPYRPTRGQVDAVTKEIAERDPSQKYTSHIAPVNFKTNSAGTYRTYEYLERCGCVGTGRRAS